MKIVLQKKLAMLSARMASRLWPKCPELLEFYEKLIINQAMADQAIHGHIITRIDPMGVIVNSLNDKVLIKKLARRIHNQRVVLRQNWDRVAHITMYYGWTRRWDLKQRNRLKKAEAKVKIIEQRYFHSTKEREDE